MSRGVVQGLELLGKDMEILGLAEEFGVKVSATFSRRLVFFNLNAVGFGVGVLANAGHLPGHFRVRAAGTNLKAIVPDLARDLRLHEVTTVSRIDHRELVAEVVVEGPKPVG